MTTVKRVFMVDGQPFFPLGGQSCNSSGYNDKESATAFKVIKLLHGNTLEIPCTGTTLNPGKAHLISPRLMTLSQQHAGTASN